MRLTNSLTTTSFGEIRIRGAEISSDAGLGFISVSAALLCRSILRRNGVSRVGSVPSSAVVPKSLPKGAFG
jgi:hypothetical protein